jgi:L-2,4-diaminobutyrate transaminase
MQGPGIAGDQPSLQDLDRRYAIHPFTSIRDHDVTGPLMMISGQGCRLTDSSGKSYLDAMAGLWCVNIGYGNEEMARAMSQQVERLSYYHSFSSMANDVSTRLAAQLISMAPVPMARVFFGMSGSDANDTEIKLVWYYNNVLGRPRKKKIISRFRGYHGVTALTAGLTGLDNLHDGFDLPFPMIRYTRAPHRLWEAEPGMTDADFTASLANDLEQLILAEDPDTVAAFIAEPVQAAGGVIIPPDGYFAAIGEVLRRYDVLLIADEVVSAFGRLGQWFGTEAFGLQPDLITLAKGITSAYVPLSASLVSARIADALEAGGDKYGVLGHGYTYSAHPLAATAALTNLSIVARDGLVDQASFADHPLVGQVRGHGLIGAVEFVASRSPMQAFDPGQRVAARVTAASREAGVLTRALPASDTIAFSPPFIVTETELDEMVDVTRRALDQVAAELGRE